MSLRVQCDQCGSSYVLPESRLTPGRRVQFACRHCQHRIVVPVPAAAAADSSPRPSQPVAAARPAPQPISSNVMWFIATADGRQERLGAEGVRAAITAGTVQTDTLLWRKGFAEWMPAGETQEWAAAVKSVARSARVAHAAEPVQAVQQAAAVRLVAAAARAPAPAPQRPDPSESTQVAGMAAVLRTSGLTDGSQVAVAMPIIRPLPESTDRPTPAEPKPQAGVVHPFPTRPARSEATAVYDVVGPAPADASADGAEARTGRPKSSWSPATDTYTGPKGNVTRRVPEEQRVALLHDVAHQEALVREAEEGRRQAEADGAALHRLRLVAGGLGVLAVVAATVAVFAMVRWRAAAAELEACRDAAPAAITTVP